MQIVSCSVFLSGDRNHMVRKHGVTVAEVLVLQHVHGSDAVTDIQKTQMDKRSHADELARLRNEYKPKIVDAIYPNRPGLKLPVTLEELGIGLEGAADELEEDEEEIVEEQAAPEPKKAAPKKAAAGKKAEAKDEESSASVF